MEFERKSSDLISEAICKVLESEGMGILLNAGNLVAALRTQLPQDDSSTSALLANCDDNLLAPLEDIASGNLSKQSLDNADHMIEYILRSERKVDKEIAVAIANGITGGVARYAAAEDEANESIGSCKGSGQKIEQQLEDVGQEAGEFATGVVANESKMDNHLARWARANKRNMLYLIALILASIGLIYALVPKETEIQFFTGDPNETSSDPWLVVVAKKNESFDLPDCDYEWEHHRFVGWRATDKMGDYEKPVLEPGSTVDTDAQATYYAAWETEVIYEGHGSDNDERVVQWTDNTGRIKLKECTFKRDGYEFVGWQDTSCQKQFPAGTVVETDDRHLVYHAIWEPITTHITINSPEDTVTKSIEGWKSKLNEGESTTKIGTARVAVQNNTDKTLKLQGELSILSEVGNKICKRYDTVTDVLPGDTSVLAFSNSVIGAEAVVTIKASEKQDRHDADMKSRNVYRMPTRYSYLLTFPLDYYRGDCPDDVEIAEVSYDAKGRLEKKTVENSGRMPLSYESDYGYDDKNRLSTVCVKVGESITYNWALRYSEDGKSMNAVCTNVGGIDGGYVNETYDDEGKTLTRDFMVGFQDYDETKHDYVDELVPIIGHEVFIYDDNDQLKTLTFDSEWSGSDKDTVSMVCNISYDENGFINRIVLDAPFGSRVYECTFELWKGLPVPLYITTYNTYNETEYIYKDGMLKSAYDVYSDYKDSYGTEIGRYGYSLRDGNEMQEIYVAVEYEDIASESGIVPQLAINSLDPIGSIKGHLTDIWAGFSYYSFDGIWFVYPEIWSLNQKWHVAHNIEAN